MKRTVKTRLLLNRLLDTWQDLRSDDQAYLVEALEQLSVNPDITSAAINSLKDACASLRLLQSTINCSKSHAILFVGSKLLALYSRFVCFSIIKFKMFNSVCLFIGPQQRVAINNRPLCGIDPCWSWLKTILDLKVCSLKAFRAVRVSSIMKILSFLLLKLS